MNKEDILKEKLRDEYLEDLEAEKNKRDITVFLKVEVTINTHDTQIAVEEAINLLNENDIYDYCREIKAEDETY